MNDTSQHPFELLTPDFIMNCIENQGFLCDGRLLALNSYENRVYQVGIEESEPLIAKFYRPGRWNDAQTREEHQFSDELAEHELPVVAPIKDEHGNSLFHYQDDHAEFRFALFPRKGGHAPELDNLENLLVLGRLIGRIHSIGAIKPFQHRPTIDLQSFGIDSVELIQHTFIPSELSDSYRSISSQLLDAIEQVIHRAGPVNRIRTHGDCHIGNVLWRDNTANFVDLDDARMAPAIQDLWMLLSGERHEKTQQLSKILQGYRAFYHFDINELQLIEALRALRMLYYSAWLARRWDDPAFPHNFPWFNTPRYWDQHILELREQLAMLSEPVLLLD